MRIKHSLRALYLMVFITVPAHAADTGHDHGGSIYNMFRLDMDAGLTTHGTPVQSWDLHGWLGTDENKLWLQSEGKHNENELETAEMWALYSRNIATYWDAQAGMRVDLEPRGTAYATFGINGLAPYFFETEAHFFISHRGDITARLREENDFLITQKLILQPYAEINFSAQEVKILGLGAGLTEGEIGLQTRYEITRKFAPYLDIHYGRKFGATSAFAQSNEEEPEETAFSLGLRLMF